MGQLSDTRIYSNVLTMFYSSLIRNLPVQEWCMLYLLCTDHVMPDVRLTPIDLESR